MKGKERLKEDILVSLDDIPPEGLKEVKTFLDFMRYKFKKKAHKSTPYVPVALGGLWKGAIITDQDIEEIRREFLSMTRNTPKDFINEMRLVAAIKWYEIPI